MLVASLYPYQANYSTPHTRATEASKPRSLGNSFESLGLFDIVHYKDSLFLQSPEMKHPRQLGAMSSNKLSTTVWL